MGQNFSKDLGFYWFLLWSWGAQGDPFERLWKWQLVAKRLRPPGGFKAWVCEWFEIVSTRVVKTKTTTWLRWRFARFVLNNMKRRTVGKRQSDKGLCYKLKAKNACYRMFFGVVMWYLDEAKRIWLQNDWSTRSMRKMRFLSICEYLWYQEKNILQWPFLDIIHSWALHFVVFFGDPELHFVELDARGPWSVATKSLHKVSPDISTEIHLWWFGGFFIVGLQIPTFVVGFPTNIAVHINIPCNLWLPGSLWPSALGSLVAAGLPWQLLPFAGPRPLRGAPGGDAASGHAGRGAAAAERRGGRARVGAAAVELCGEAEGFQLVMRVPWGTFKWVVSLLGKIPEMDDDWGYPYDETEPPNI